MLIHIGSNPWHKWEPLLARLTEQFDVLVPTLPGWPGGPQVNGEISLSVLADAVERAMDDAGLGTAHIVGNSLGGWLAFELAERGRARTAVAFSPAGGWSRRGFNRCARWFYLNKVLSALTRPLVPLFLRFGIVRKIMFAMIVKNGDRLTPSQAVNQTRDTMPGAFDRILPSLGREGLRDYSDLEVPTLIAWSGEDRFTPLHPDSDAWRAASPRSEFQVLDGCGHLPMFDRSDLVLDAIATTAARAG